MGQHHRIDVRGVGRQRVPVAQAQLFVTLKQAAIDQQPLLVVLNQVFGAGDGVGPSKEGDGGAHAGMLRSKYTRAFEASHVDACFAKPTH